MIRSMESGIVEPIENKREGRALFVVTISFYCTFDKIE